MSSCLLADIYIYIYTYFLKLLIGSQPIIEEGLMLLQCVIKLIYFKIVLFVFIHIYLFITWIHPLKFCTPILV